METSGDARGAELAALETMSELTLTTRENYTQFYPGEELAGEAAWRLDEAADALEVRLFWWTSGKGTQDVKVVGTHRIEAPDLDGQEPFAFTVPLHPYSFSGKLISLQWGLELVALPSGEAHRMDLTISPSGEEVLLGNMALAEEPEAGSKTKWFSFRVGP